MTTNATLTAAQDWQAPVDLDAGRRLFVSHRDEDDLVFWAAVARGADPPSAETEGHVIARDTRTAQNGAVIQFGADVTVYFKSRGATRLVLTAIDA